MENVTDALIMAGQVLIFILALSVCMSSFTNLRGNITEMIGQTETIKMAKDSDGYINYVESSNGKATRMVGAETVVASMYRAVKENYIVYIKLVETTDWHEVEHTGTILIEAQPDVVNTDETAKIKPGDKLIKVTIGREASGVNEKVNSILSNGLYNIIKGRKFKEYLGEYQNGTAASSENRVTKRIITYVEST